MDDPRLGREFGEGDGRGRGGEVEDAIGADEGGERVGAKRDAVRSDAGEFAGVAADFRRVGPLDRCLQHRSRRLGDHPDQRPPHPSGGADDDELHVGHGPDLHRVFTPHIAGTGRPGKPSAGAGRGMGGENRLEEAAEIVGQELDVGRIPPLELPLLVEDLARAAGHDQHRRHAERVRHREVAGEVLEHRGARGLDAGLRR